MIGVPMHNFSIPSTLRLWIDQVVRAGRTFSYGGGAPEGLLNGKKATVLVASGGVYDEGTAMASFNFIEPYLRTVLAFIGVKETNFINAGGTAVLELRQSRPAGIPGPSPAVDPKSVPRGMTEAAGGEFTETSLPGHSFATLRAKTHPISHGDELYTPGRDPLHFPHRARMRGVREEGRQWVHLRMCLFAATWAVVTPRKTSTRPKHYGHTGHPLMRSIERGENWGWCYVDQVDFDV